MDILAFTETWFSDCSDNTEIDGYVDLSMYRKKRVGGGISLYVKNSMHFHFLRDMWSVHAEYELLTAEVNGITMLLLHQPTSGNVNNFVSHINNIIADVTNKKPVVILGDFNTDVQSDSFAKTRLLDLMFSCSCANTINVPTHITADTSDFLLSDMHSVVMVFDIIDHLPFFAFLPPTMYKHRQLCIEKLTTH